jgi:hypothetical protein
MMNLLGKKAETHLPGREACKPRAGLEKMKTYGIAIGKPMAVRVSMPGRTGSIARKTAPQP